MKSFKRRSRRSETVVVPPPPPPPPPPVVTGLQPFFTDSFVGGVRNPANGFEWAGGSTSTNPSISAERAFSGTHSMRFRYGATAPGGQSWSEERFDMGRYIGEVAFEYMLYVPANYKHREQPSGGAGTNNKFFSIWRDTYGGTSGAIEMSCGWWRTSDFESYARYQSTFSSINGVTPFADQQQFMGPNTPMTPGAWHRIRVYIKTATYRAGDARTADGIMRMWINDVEFFKFTKGDFNNFDPAFGPPVFRRAYLLGYMNSGFDEETIFFVDDFKIWDGRPDWVPLPATPVVHDRFESGALNDSAALTWGSAVGGAAMQLGTQFPGNTHDLVLTYAPTASGTPSVAVSQPFTLTTPASELWVEFKWFPPANVLFRGTGSQYNPILTIGSPTGGPFVQIGLRSNAPFNNTQGMASVQLQRGEVTTVGQAPNQSFPTDATSRLLGPVDCRLLPGKNTTMRVYVKMSTTKTSNDGRVIWWANEFKAYDSGPVSLNSASNSAAAAVFSNGAFGGVHVQGYDAETSYRYGSLKVYTTDPEWGT